MTVRQDLIERRTNGKRKILPAACVRQAWGQRAVGQNGVAKEAHQQPQGVLGVYEDGQARHELAEIGPRRDGNFLDPI